MGKSNEFLRGNEEICVFFMPLSEIVLYEGNYFSMNIKYVMVAEFFQC